MVGHSLWVAIALLVYGAATAPLAVGQSVNGGTCELFFHSDARAPGLGRKYVPSATWVLVPDGQRLTDRFASLDVLQILVDIIPRDVCRDAFAQAVVGQMLPACASEARGAAPGNVVRVCKASCEATLLPACIAEERALIERGIRELNLEGVSDPFDCSQYLDAEPDRQPGDPATDDLSDATGVPAAPKAGTCHTLWRSATHPFRAAAPHATCEEYTGSSCRGVTSGKIYLPGGVCQADLENRVALLPTTLAVTHDPACAEAMAKAVCHMVFMPCDQGEIPKKLRELGIALPETTTTVTSSTVTETDTDASTSPPTTATTRVQTIETVVEQIAPTYPLPRFPDLSLCRAYQDRCSGSAPADSPVPERHHVVPNWIGPFGTAYYPDVESDRIKSQMLLRTLTPNCDSRTRAPGLQADFPSSADGERTAFEVFGLSTEPNRGDAAVQPAPGAADDFNALFKPACMPFSSAAIRATGAVSYCAGVVAEGTPVFVPGRHSLSRMNDELADMYRNTIEPLPRSQCTYALAQFACARVFMPCWRDGEFTIDDEGSIKVPYRGALPRVPCRSACERFESRCSELFAVVPNLRPDCDAVDAVPYTMKTCGYDQTAFVTDVTLQGADAGGARTSDEFRPPLGNVNFPREETLYARIKTGDRGFVPGLGSVLPLDVVLKAPCSPVDTTQRSWPNDGGVIDGGDDDGGAAPCGEKKLGSLLARCDCTLATCPAVVCGGVDPMRTVPNQCTKVKVQILACDGSTVGSKAAALQLAVNTLKSFQASCPQGADVGLVAQSVCDPPPDDGEVVVGGGS